MITRSLIREFFAAPFDWKAFTSDVATFGVGPLVICGALIDFAWEHGAMSVWILGPLAAVLLLMVGLLVAVLRVHSTEAHQYIAELEAHIDLLDPPA